MELQAGEVTMKTALQKKERKGVGRATSLHFHRILILWGFVSFMIWNLSKNMEYRK